jgi:divalent metal cation (Fe/Co/Zn/Cd) transporter
MSRTLTVAWGSLAVSAVVLGLKFAAYWLTGSVALYSDALETVINVVAAAGALVAVWLKLTRFGGALQAFIGGFTDAEDTSALFA